jgi:hypothetical protein
LDSSIYVLAKIPLARIFYLFIKTRNIFGCLK